jgi:hypothetical protein
VAAAQCAPLLLLLLLLLRLLCTPLLVTLPHLFQ